MKSLPLKPRAPGPEYRLVHRLRARGGQGRFKQNEKTADVIANAPTRIRDAPQSASHSRAAPKSPGQCRQQPVMCFPSVPTRGSGIIFDTAPQNDRTITARWRSAGTAPPACRMTRETITEEGGTIKAQSNHACQNHHSLRSRAPGSPENTLRPRSRRWRRPGRPANG